MQYKCYRPKTIVQYNRKAYIAKENKIRITFDNNIIATESSFDLFSENLLMYPVLDKFNVALSLGMVGALSIVRFRTAIKDSRDTVYIFWTIIVGICCGVGDFIVAGIGSGFVFVILLILGAIKNNNRMLVIIRGSRTKEAPISAVMFKFFGGKANMRVKNSTDTSIEFIYEITANMLQKAERKNNIGICDEIYKIGNIEYVNTVMQNDEISN